MSISTLKKMRMIDLSHTIKEGMTVYPGDPEPKIIRVKTIARQGVNLTKLEIGVHNGTHVDAPSHFIQDAVTVDKIKLQRLCGDAVTLDFSSKKHGSAITGYDLKRYARVLRRNKIVLLYTGVSRYWDKEWVKTNFTYLSEDGAKMLAEKGVKAVGIDCLSIEKFGSKAGETHKILLSKGIPIIESLNSNLAELVNKDAILFCFPISIYESEAAPARAIAFVKR